MDGDDMELANLDPFELPFLDEECYGPLPMDAKLTFHHRRFTPELTPHGWIVRWRES